MPFTVTSDTISNQFIGELSYGNHALSSPNLNFLKTSVDVNGIGVTPNSDLALALEEALDNAGLIYSLSGNFLDANNAFEINWSSPADLTRPASGRFRIGFNDGGSVIIQARDDDDNLVLGSASSFTIDSKLFAHYSATDYLRPAWYFTISPQSIAFGAQVVNQPGEPLSYFVYSGYLQNVNDNFNYYTEKQINSCFVMSKSHLNVWKGYHYIANTNKEILSSNNAAYPIVCADNQTPTIEWTSSLYVFDNNEALGYPGIGKVHNMIASTSQMAHSIGVPAVITSTTKPDTGNNRWLPIGVWLSKTLFIRVK